MATERPRCIVNTRHVKTFDRPPSEGVAWRVRPVGDVAGLTRMGVKLREVEPGSAGTHFHFHSVEEEWAFVLSGSGRVRIGALSLPVRSGHLAAFPPGPRPHHFIAEGDEPLLVLEGGERRPDEDWCTYPELGVRSQKGADAPIDRERLPPWTGDAGQLVHLEQVAEVAVPHPGAPAAVRLYRRIGRAAGLERQAMTFVRLEPGIDSTAYHTHEATDEWVYLLAGSAELRLGDERHEVAGGDFIAHPAGGPPHALRALTELTYLMGGESSEDDVVTYPDLGMQKTREGFTRR